jgi:hypothetical protein
LYNDDFRNRLLFTSQFVLEVEVVRAHKRLVQAKEEMKGLDARPAKFKFHTYVLLFYLYFYVQGYAFPTNIHLRAIAAI